METEKKIHELKTWKEYFQEVFMGHKTFELRFNDRDFKKGDLLNLKEWDNEKKEYTGREITRTVVYILYGDSETQHFGIIMGFCIMSIQ